MSTTNINILTQYLDKNNVQYTIDKNPSAEKISGLKKAIARKESLAKSAVEFYNNLLNKS